MDKPLPNSMTKAVLLAADDTCDNGQTIGGSAKKRKGRRRGSRKFSKIFKSQRLRNSDL